MNYTSHGHHIPGTPSDGMPDTRARCGGPGLCSICSREAMQQMPESHVKIIKEIPEMDNQLRARLLVAQYFNRKAEKTDQALLTTDDVYIVWFCYILGGWKALVSTTVVDGMYYEVTYDKTRGVTYLDAYKKWENLEIRDGHDIHTFPKEGSL